MVNPLLLWELWEVTAESRDYATFWRWEKTTLRVQIHQSVWVRVCLPVVILSHIRQTLIDSYSNSVYLTELLLFNLDISISILRLLQPAAQGCSVRKCIQQSGHLIVTTPKAFPPNIELGRQVLGLNSHLGKKALPVLDSQDGLRNRISLLMGST